MNNTFITYQLFQAKGAYGFDAQASQLLFAYRPTGLPVRLVFFDSPCDKEEYYTRMAALYKRVEQMFRHPVPVSYVAQPSCSGRVMMEVHELNNVPADAHIVYNKYYCLVEHGGCKQLFVSGINKSKLVTDRAGQALRGIRRIKKILESAEMPLSSIVRQWNYIERIAGFDEDGAQHYQGFNNERAAFYDETTWEKGYPAATGIGMEQGGVTMDLDAVTGPEDRLQIHRLNNPLQRAAYAYSGRVLRGKNRRDTPKFERGKVVSLDGKSMIYISGTAAIRGEQSLEGKGVEEQTWATLENIAALLSRKNLSAWGVEIPSEIGLQYLRVYLKRPEDEPCVRNIVEKAYPGLTVLYVVADICRDELLVEMEGVAHPVEA